MKFSDVTATNLLSGFFGYFLVCFVVETTELSRPRGDLTFRGNSRRSWGRRRRFGEVECAKIDLNDRNSRQFST
jgi:hypothetical protein